MAEACVHVARAEDDVAREAAQTRWPAERFQ
jgi:hypothetical protein